MWKPYAPQHELGKDPEELTNVAEKYPEIAAGEQEAG
jgi:hypothetical protein